MPEDAAEAIDTKADVARRWGRRVPIVIGGIGHRNLHPADGKLAAAVRGECRKLGKQYKASPFVVLSALAEGADRLIAKTAMEELGADLVAVLPMPAADYERDFQTEDFQSGVPRLSQSRGLRENRRPAGRGRLEGGWRAAQRAICTRGRRDRRPRADPVCDLGWSTRSRHWRHRATGGVVFQRLLARAIRLAQDHALAAHPSGIRLAHSHRPGQCAGRYRRGRQSREQKRNPLNLEADQYVQPRRGTQSRRHRQVNSAHPRPRRAGQRAWAYRGRIQCRGRGIRLFRQQSAQLGNLHLLSGVRLDPVAEFHQFLASRPGSFSSSQS